MLSFRGGSPFGDAIPFGVALCGRPLPGLKQTVPDKRFIGAKIVNPAIMRGRGLGMFFWNTKSYRTASSNASNPVSKFRASYVRIQKITARRLDTVVASYLGKPVQTLFPCGCILNRDTLRLRFSQKVTMLPEMMSVLTRLQHLSPPTVSDCVMKTPAR